MKIRRIIVGIGSTPRDKSVIEAAARVAARLEAELVGLFVENADLLSFAALPFAREVGFASATRRELDVEAMERSLRALADESRRMLAAVAGAVPVRWSFRVTRGSSAVELLAAAGEADLVVANMEPIAGTGQAVRLIRAGDPGALRAAMEQRDGILVLTGTDPAAIGEALLQLLNEELP
jgi:K+-sensing histidine kinase KdpD